MANRWMWYKENWARLKTHSGSPGVRWMASNPAAGAGVAHYGIWESRHRLSSWGSSGVVQEFRHEEARPWHCVGKWGSGDGVSNQHNAGRAAEVTTTGLRFKAKPRRTHMRINVLFVNSCGRRYGGGVMALRPWSWSACFGIPVLPLTIWPQGQCMPKFPYLLREIIIVPPPWNPVRIWWDTLYKALRTVTAHS